MFYPDVLFWLLWTGKQLTPVFGQPAALSTTKRNLITDRVLQACDANDGLVDGQITNPRACSFDIDKLGPSGENVLTAQELATVKAMYAGTTNEITGQQRYSGAKFGSEANFDPNFADNGGYGPFIGHFVYSLLSPPYEWRRDINWSTVYDQAKAVLSPITAAPSPDIRAFTSRGGKIVHYHGWNDSVVPPDGSIAYLHSLTQFEKLQHLPKHAFDQQERLPDDGHAITIEQIRSDDDVGDAGLVLEREEHEALRGAGPLARDDHAGHAHAAAVARLRQIRRAQHAAQRKVVAAQRHRMRSDR